MLPGNLCAAAVIRPGALYMRKLGRHKPGLSAFGLALCQLLHPFQGSLPCFKVGLQNGIALCHIVSTRFPVIIFGIGILSVVEMDCISFRHLLAFGNAKLFLLRFLCEVPFKIGSGVGHQVFGQLIGDHRVVLSFLRCPVVGAAAPALHLFQIPVFYKEAVIGPHGVLHGADP